MKTYTQKTPATKLPLKIKASTLALLGAVIGLIQPGSAAETPPGCGQAGKDRYQHTFNFGYHQAHLGDTVPFVVRFGMEADACQATNVNASLYLASGKAFDTLRSTTFVPGDIRTAPMPPFEQVPYEILITPELVGAGVSNASRGVQGVPGKVQALHCVTGEVMTEFLDAIRPSRSDFIDIVTPGIQVTVGCAYPPGRSSFEAALPVKFTGFVTNSGDIRLINVTISPDRPLLGGGLWGLNGLPLLQPLTIDPGQVVGFKGSYAPTAQETCAQSAGITVTVRGKDITMIECPRASVTNSMTARAAISPFGPAAILSAPTCTADHHFQFNVLGQPGLPYVVQAAETQNSTNWISIHTNTAPFIFVDPNPVSGPRRLFRVMSLPYPCTGGNPTAN